MIKTNTMKHLFVLDNGGETFDRYTIVNTLDGEMIGASANPFSPLGFGQYMGNVADNFWRNAYGYAWRNGCDQKLITKRIKHAIAIFKSDCAHIGKRIPFNKLPKDVQEYASTNLLAF